MTTTAKRCRHPAKGLRHWLVPADEGGENMLDADVQTFFHLYYCPRCGSLRTREGWVHPESWPQDSTGTTGGFRVRYTEPRRDPPKECAF